jgi:hypothetical protein
LFPPSFLHYCSKRPLPSQNISRCSLECMVPTCRPEWTTTYLGAFFFFPQWGLIVAISNVANVKFELPRPLNPGYFFQLCCVAKLVIVRARRFSQIWL